MVVRTEMIGSLLMVVRTVMVGSLPVVLRMSRVGYLTLEVRMVRDSSYLWDMVKRVRAGSLQWW
jgi:hypothetical protein